MSEWARSTLKWSRVTKPFEEVFLVRGHPSLPPAQIASEKGNVFDALVGTPAYLAPEQADPDRFGPATTRTDVYGLGGILYHVVFGDAPNQGHSTSDIFGSLNKRKGPPAPGPLQFADPSTRQLAKTLEPICLCALHGD